MPAKQPLQSRHPWHITRSRCRSQQMAVAIAKLDVANLEVRTETLFRGSHGPVHLAKLKSTGADVVVKKFAGQDRTSRKAFEEDSQLMACQSGHPHVAALLGIADFPNNWQIFEMTRLQASARRVPLPRRFSC